MRAVLTAVIAAIEAVAVALAVFAAIAIPAVLLWWLTFDLGADPFELLHIVTALWQLVHLVPMHITVEPQLALSLGLSAEALEFTLSLAPLGLTLLTVALAFRSGWRFAGRGVEGAWSMIGGAVGFCAAATLVALLGARQPGSVLWVAIAVPTIVYALATAVGVVLRSVKEGLEWWGRTVRALQRAVQKLAPIGAAALPERSAEVVRLAAAGTAALLGLAGIGFAIAVVFGYVETVTLSQGLQLDALGASMLFLLQLVMLPVCVIWAVAWFAGPGFSLGVATSVTPFETLLGPLPALPLFGAIPQGWGWAGALAPALVVALGAVLGALAAGRPLMRRASAPLALAITLKAALIVGLAFVALSVLASGSLGPGRLAETGPSPWIVGGFLTLELGFGMSLGAFARRVDVDRVRDSDRRRRAGSPSGVAPLSEFDSLGGADGRQEAVLPASNPVAGVVIDDGSNAETIPIEPLQSDAAPPLAAPSEPSIETSSDAPSTDPSEQGSDPLLLAYAWDADSPSEPQSKKRRSWRDRLR